MVQIREKNADTEEVRSVFALFVFEDLRPAVYPNREGLEGNMRQIPGSYPHQ